MAEKIAPEVAAWIIHDREDEYYGRGSDTVRFSPLTEGEKEVGLTATPLYRSALSPGSTGSAEGWVLVPREPTEAMVAAAIGPDDGALFGSRKLATDVMRARYRAMIDAAGGRDE